MSLSLWVSGAVGTLRLNVRLEVPAGGVVLVGPNGAGKTTLLWMALGLLRPEEGRVTLGERVLYDSAQGVDVPTEARGLGYVPQSYALFPHLTVAQNVAFGAARAASPAEREAATAEAIASFELQPLVSRRPGFLSGGERQRVALARCLASRPSALLLDEPLAALDAQAREQVRRTLARRLAALALPSLVVTHDAQDAAALGAKVAVLEAGALTQLDAPARLAEAPATPFVRRLFS